MSGAPFAIRHVRDDDFDDIEALYASAEVMAQTSQVPYRSAEFWRRFYGQHADNAVELVALDAQRIVGHLGIVMNARPRRKHAAWFGIAVHAQHHGRGIGTALMGELIDLADNWLNLVKLELAVFADNARAIAMYEKFGFLHEGRLRYDTFRNGRYVDTLRMARFHPGLAPP